MLLHTRSFARLGLVGNPSDGYYGKTVSCVFENFWADVTIYETPELEILPGDVDEHLFKDLDHLVKDVRLFGYYGGVRLLKATSKVFAEHCREQGIALPKRNFTARYTSNIPRLVGLSGSSAICTAMFKALMKFYEVEIPLPLIPTLCLNAEKRELGIECGLQDRVIQMYEGMVYMDFDRTLVEGRGYGEYLPMDPGLLPPIYVAYDPSRAEVSGIYHQKLRVLFEEKKPDIVAAMSEFADLACQTRDALLAGRKERIPVLMNANFDLRDRVFNVAPENRRMVHVARGIGAAAKFAGSGGAIVGTYEDEAMYNRLVTALGAIGCTVLKPILNQGRWHQ
jgi:glucuronokinase